MGFSHYWERPQTIEPATWRPLYRDMLAVLDALPSTYPGPYHTGEPLEIRGGASGDRSFDPENIEGWDGDPSEVIQFNGNQDAQTASTTFLFSRVRELADHERLTDDGRVREHCKTGRQPYDLAVCAELLVCRHHLGEAFNYSSDAPAFGQSWPHALPVVRDVLGREDFCALLEDHLSSSEKTPHYGTLLLAARQTVPEAASAVITPEKADELVRRLPADNPYHLLWWMETHPEAAAPLLDRDLWADFVDEALGFGKGRPGLVGRLLAAVPDRAEAVLRKEDLEGIRVTTRRRILFDLLEAAPGTTIEVFEITEADVVDWLKSDDRHVRQRALLAARHLGVDAAAERATHERNENGGRRP